jgi:hypothetical protein
MNVRLDLILDSPVSPDSCRELEGVQKEHRLAPAAVRTWVLCFVYGLVLRAEVRVTDGGMPHALYSRALCLISTTIRFKISFKFPVSSQLEFIHTIPEEDFDILTTIITDVGFLGLFPKMIFEMLQNYGREMEQCQDTYWR